MLSSLVHRRWLVIAVSGLVICLVIWGVNWLTFSRQPLPSAIDALESDEWVSVTYHPWLTFLPAQGDVNTGFVFYPGGRINHKGYAPLMRRIALEGYLVVVPDMPLNIAVLQPNIAKAIMSEYPNINQWVIGGHSVGGAMAAQYTYTHSESIAGLVIWASYPPDNADLSDFKIPVTLIYGSRETRVTDTSVSARKHLLPADTIYVRIEGGDHHQFGEYEIDAKEHGATISRERQHSQILEPTLNVLFAVSGGYE